MAYTYDKDGNCTRCGLPGNGFVADGVCMCREIDEDRERRPDPAKFPISARWGRRR